MFLKQYSFAKSKPHSQDAMPLGGRMAAQQVAGRAAH